MTFDIIKGERTYQYFNSDPLYAFGYGLTYGDFAYSDVQLSEVEDEALLDKLADIFESRYAQAMEDEEE